MNLSRSAPRPQHSLARAGRSISCSSATALTCVRRLNPLCERAGTICERHSAKTSADELAFRAALYFKLHTSTTFGKGAPGSSQTTMVELEVVAVPPLGSRITVEEPGLDDEDCAPLDVEVMFALELETEPTVFAV